jgi:2-hydroxy-3-keto-5-methylthiopentenyl-1-phosphate phosphatase
VNKVKEQLHVNEVFTVIDQLLDQYRKDRDKITSLTEHVHQQAAMDALLIVKSQLKIRTRM